MDVKTMIGVGVGVMSLVGGLFAIDARYQHRAEAAEQYAQQAVDDERARLELQLEIKTHELEWLMTKEYRSESDERKMLYLERVIDRIEHRLMELDRADGD